MYSSLTWIQGSISIMDTTLPALFLVGSALFPSVFLSSAFLLRTWVGVRSRDVCTAVAMRITSIFHAVLASAVGWYIVINCYQDFLYARCWIVDKYLCFGLPYMLYDMGAMYASFHVDLEVKHSTILSKSWTFLPFLRKEKLLLFHHLMVALVGYPLAVFYRNGKGEFFLGCMLLTELSSPFVNLRGILKKINMKNSLLYYTNNALILIVFFLCRIFIFPVIFWVYSWDQQFSWIKVPFMIPWHCTLGCSIIVLFQCMWYYMFAWSIWRGLQRKHFDANCNGTDKNPLVGQKGHWILELKLSVCIYIVYTVYIYIQKFQFSNTGVHRNLIPLWRKLCP